MEKPRFVKPGNEQLYPSFSSKTRTTGSDSQIVLPTTDQQKLSDADGETTFVYNRHHNLPLEAQRQKLPIFQYRNHVLYLLERFQTLVLVGETGSGKSTQVPQYLLESGYCSDGNKVVVTQPRVSAAASLARRVAEERGVQCGEAVGFAVSLHTECGEGTRIKYVTEGVLLREMFADPLLTSYSCVMLDEVHERSQLTDTLMGLLKKILRKRKSLKLIVSSATMDAEFLRDFFNLRKARGEGEQATSVILSVEGRSHPIDVFYVEEPVADYVKATVETVVKIHENEPFGDVLAFLTSQDEISTALSSLSDYARDNNERNLRRKHHPSGIQAADLLVLPLYGTLPFGDQLRVFQGAGRNVRKVVLATNVAETSLTIPGVVYVIDCGFHKIRYVNPETGLESLVVCPVSRNNATQRAGRAGRQTHGKCYRLYTEDNYEKLFPAIPPEIQRSDLSAILLQLKAFGIDNLLRFSFPSPPPARALLSGLETLLALGALDFEGHLTEPLGIRMAELPLQPFLAKCLCASDDFGVIEEMLSIVSMLQVENIFVKPAYGQKAIAAKVAKRNNFSVEEGDLMTYLNVYDAYKRTITDAGNSSKAAKEWCKKCFVSERSMARVVEVRASLSKIVYGKFNMENAMFDGPDLGSGKCTRLLRCLTAGLFPRACYLHHSGVYRLLSGDGVDLHISPDSCLYDFRQPQWLVFGSVSSSGDKTYIRDLVNIKKEWLCELAPHFYKEA